MRKVTEQVCRAFIKGQSKTVGNTTTDGQNLWLHGNWIAKKVQLVNTPEGTVRNGYLVRLAGWNTPTTRERLNGLCQLVGSSARFHQKNFEPYCNDIMIDDCKWYSI